MEFEFARRISSRQGMVKVADTANAQTQMLPGDGSQPTPWQQAGQPHGHGTRGENPPGSGDTPRLGRRHIPGSQPGSPKSQSDTSPKRRKGLFSIDYRQEFAENHRSRYERDTRTIVINLDHPQIAGAYNASGRNTEARQFLEISYEVAVVEYAQAIPFEKIDQEGDHYQASEALYDVRETINRVTRRFSGASCFSQARQCLIYKGKTLQLKNRQ